MEDVTKIYRAVSSYLKRIVVIKRQKIKETKTNKIINICEREREREREREKVCVTMKIERKDVCYDEDENDDRHIDYIEGEKT
jgi:hypothetical protein